MASYNTVITNEGAALLASVIGNQGTLTFSEMRFSTTDYVGLEQTLTAGTFAGTFVTAAASGSVIDTTTIKVASQFDNSAIVGDHPLYSIGVIGTDGNTTALIAVCTTSTPDVIRTPIPATSISTYAFNVNLTVASTQNITVTGTTAAVLYDVDVVNTLISTATDKPLSANMGRVLKNNLYKRNLLKNGWFTINQRGVTSVTIDNECGADDWLKGGGNGSIGFSSSGMTINNAQVQQYLNEQIPNGTYTLSARTTTGDIYSGTITKTDDISDYVAINYDPIYLAYAANLKAFVIYTSGTIALRAVKLEVGSKSTLANDVAPNYTTELLKCQREFYRVTIPTYTLVANMFCETATLASATFKLPVEMRTNPTLTLAGALSLYDGVNIKPITNLTINTIQKDLVILIATSTGLTIGQMMQMVSAGSEVVLDFATT